MSYMSYISLSCFFVAQVVENKWIVGIAAFLITIGLFKTLEVNI